MQSKYSLSLQWSRKNCTKFNGPLFCKHCSRIMQLSPKCSWKIIVYQSMQNLCQLDKYSLINSRNWICHEWCHPACEQDNSDSWRSTANKPAFGCQTSINLYVCKHFALKPKKAGLLKNDCWVYSEIVEMTYAVWSLTNNSVYWQC